MKQISDNEIYLLTNYIKSILWRVVKRLSYIEEARCLKVKESYTLTNALPQKLKTQYLDMDNPVVWHTVIKIRRITVNATYLLYNVSLQVSNHSHSHYQASLRIKNIQPRT